MDLDFEDVLTLLVTLAVIPVAALAWWSRSEYSRLPMERVELLGRFGDVNLEVTVDGFGRRRVAFCYMDEDDDGQPYEVRVLLTAKRARQVASWLRQASGPGSNLVQARWNLRRAAREAGSA